MAHSYINWTKTYDVWHVKGHFNVYLSSHKTGHFFAAVLYYVEGGEVWPDGTTPSFTMKTEHLFSFEEDDVYKQATNWIDQNLPGKYTIVLRDKQEF